MTSTHSRKGRDSVYDSKLAWTPEEVDPTDIVLERLKAFTDMERAFVVFKNGTAVFSDSKNARSDGDYQYTLEAAIALAPDFRTLPMEDGNLLIRFRGPVTGLVLREFYHDHESGIVTSLEDGGLLPGELLKQPVPEHDNSWHYYAGLFARAKLFADVESRVIEHRFVPHG